jgi:uncharacterized protein (TIGR03435 family)
MRIFTGALFLAAIAPSLLGQPGDTTPAFEVVSVKPSDPNRRYSIGMFTYPGGRVEATYVPVDYLIQQAYDIQPFQISGEPRWAREERFDLVGKPPESSPSSKSNPAISKLPPNPEQRQMLQAALVDRFGLKYHWETKEGEIYLLVKSGKGLKLQPAKDKDDYPWAGGFSGPPFSNGIQGINETMANLAERISPVLGRTVIDRTGIDGSFDFAFRYPGDEANPDIGAVILTSVQGLGLKLEPNRGPVKILAIDHLERPSAN